MYNTVMTTGTVALSGMANISWPEPSPAEEAHGLYSDAEAWAITQGYPEDLSEAWKIMPMDVVDPALEEEWKAQRLWMLDPLDDVTGDDAMPALCGTCHGVYWGDEMMSLSKAIRCLHDRHHQALQGSLGSIWGEAKAGMIEKMRNNRICKKCYQIRNHQTGLPWTNITCSGSWDSTYTHTR